MKKTLFSTLLFCLFTCSACAQETLTVYTSLELEYLPKYKKLVEKVLPDYSINWYRDSTGIVTAKLLAEADAPQADVVIGIAASALLLLENRNLLDSYTPQNIGMLSSGMYSSSEPITWVGTAAWASAFCVNTIELEKRNLPMPTSWADLAKPEYKGLIAMPSPASSGTGFMNISAWIQMFGEEKAWEYAEALMANTKLLTHSGSAPCTMAAQGEVVIGISSASFMQTLLKRHAPIAVVVPQEGVGWDLEAAAIMKGASHKEAAEKIIDLMTSDEIAQLGSEFSGITARPDFISPAVQESVDKMIDNDFVWAAENRERILKEWKERFAQ